MPKRLKFVTEQWVLFMVRQQTWQARRFKIVESACHFRIQSNLDARFESNLEASQVPIIIIIIITYFCSHWYTTWVLRVAYQETTFRTEIRREVGLGECPKKLGSLLTGCRRSSKTWWWRHNRSCRFIKVCVVVVVVVDGAARRGGGVTIVPVSSSKSAGAGDVRGCNELDDDDADDAMLSMCTDHEGDELLTNALTDTIMTWPLIISCLLELTYTSYSSSCCS